MKRTFTFLMTALFLCVGMVKAAVTDVPEMSTEGNIKWYTISNTRSVSGKYLYWTANGVKDANTLSGASLFYFTGESSEACFIHNAATELLFSGAGAWTAEGVSCKISETPHSSKAGVAIEFSGTSLNEQNHADGYTTYGANDGGSIFVISPATVSIEEAIAALEANKAAGNTIMGEYKYEEEAYNNLVAALATLKTAAGAEAVAAFESCVAIMANLTYVMPEAGKFYVIECPIFKAAQGVSKGLNGTPGWNTIDLTDTNYYWTVEVNDGTYALKNLGTGTYLNGTAMSESAAYAKLTSLGEQQFNIVVNGTTIHANGHNGGAAASGNLVSWAGSANSASAWMFIEKADPTSLVEVAVTYSFTYGGEEKYTQTASTLVGEEWPAITVALPYGVSANKPEGTIAAEDHTDGAVTIVIELAVAELPFVAAEDVNSIEQWYHATMHSNYPKYIEENADGGIDWVKESIEDDDAETLVWGFAGNVFDGIKVVNKGTGHAIVSTSGAAVMGDAANATAFILSKTDTGVENGFCLKYPGSNYLNASAGKVSSWSAADAGSTFLLYPVPVVEYADEAVIGAFIAEVSAIGELEYDLDATWESLPAVLATLEALDPIIEQIEGGNPVAKADVEAATATVANAKAAAVYYNETYLLTAKAAADLLAALENGSAEHTALSEAIAACDLSAVTTVAELEAINAALAEAVEANTPEGGIVKTDYTDAIKNADLSTEEAWNTDGTKGISGGMVKVASESAFDFSQIITLPAGQYKVTAKAAYRYTGSEQDEYNAILAGTETHLVKLYAETASYKYEGDVQNRWEGASDTNLAGDGVSEVNGMFVPNSSNAVLAWFNAGQYANELVFNVQEEGTVKIGITRVGGIAGDYTNIGAWTLTRIGDAVADPDPNNYTSYIINADLSTADAWDATGTKGISDGMVKVASESAFDFNQTITLPAGQYKMTAKAVYRYTGSEAEEFAAIEAGTKTRLVNLYAETATYKYEADVMNRYDGASDTDYAAGNGSVPVNGKFVPNSSSAVQAWFDNGQYVNELVFNVQEEGQVKIGLTRTGSIAGDYTNIGAWTLTRLGDAEADPEVEEPTPDPDPTPDPTPDPEETIDMDLTHLVGTSKEAWNATGGPVTIDGISMPERYEGDANPVGDQLWQTVTGLENGKYTVELWANARVAWVSSPATDGQEELTYVFANNVEKSIAVLHNPHTTNNTSHVLEGVEVTDGTLRMGMTKKAAGSNWHTIQIKSLIYHAPANAALDMAKADLQAALDAANAVDPKKDDFVAAIAAAQDIYNNSKSVEEVEATTASLKEATKLAILGNASPSNPVLTDFVVNGTFDAGTTGWKSTTGAANQGTATNQQGAFTGAFFENWNGSNYTGKLYQVIENIPNGVYELSICAFVETFDASAQFVYANADKVALTTGAPTAYKVRTIVKNNTIEVGFEQTAAVNRWCGIDNVSLTYFGEASNEEALNAAKVAFTAAYAEFGVAMEACQAMMLKMSFYEIDDAAYQLNEQLETTTDVDALNSMAETLAEATASLKEINEVYAGYDVFVQKFKAAAEISEPKTTEAAELLEFHMYGGAGMQATSLEALAQAVQTIKADYFTYIANANLLDGNKFDLTYLIQNPNIDHNLDGWTLTGKVGRLNNNGFNGVPGIMEIGEWGATSWEAGVSQNLNELPNGKYIVKMAWMAASGIKMNLSANEASVEVTGIGDQGGNIAADGSVVEMGQGVQGWQYAEVEAFVENGTLAIAVNSSSPAQYQWSNADQFQLYYAGDLSHLYNLDETIEGDWVDVTNEGAWPIIDHAELLGLGDFWVVTNNTRYDAERGVMEFVAGENTAASLIQEYCPFGQATYRLTGKAFHKGATNAVMFVGDQTVEIPAAAEGATFENAEEYFTTFSIEFTCESAWGTQLTVGYSCEFDNAEDFLVVGGLKLEAKKSTTLRNLFMETIMACESFGYEIMNMTELHAQQQAVMVTAMPIYEAIMGGEKVLKAEVEQSIEEMNAVIAELSPVAEYYKGEFSDALWAAEEMLWELDETSQAYTDLKAAIEEASDVAAVTTVAELEAKVAALEEFMKLIETGIDNIEAETETVIYDLSGRRVEKMEKGIYIVNGKKVFKK